MNPKTKALVSLILVELLLCGMVPAPAEAGKLIRVSAQFRRFDGSFDTVNTTPAAGGTGGQVIYSRAFSVPAPPTGQQAVVFVGFWATTELLPGTLALFSCNIDGTPCNGGGAPSGWISLAAAFDAGGETPAVNYQWCAKVSPGAHTAEVRMASSAGDNILLYNAHFSIDRTTIKTSTPDDCESGTP